MAILLKYNVIHDQIVPEKELHNLPSFTGEESYLQLAVNLLEAIPDNLYENQHQLS